MMTFAALMEAVDARPVTIATVPANNTAAYDAALHLCRRIDEELTRGSRHYRTLDGLLLTTLDQVVNAIIADKLRIE